AEQQLRHLPTGGRTPLAHALRLAHDTVARWRRDQPDQTVLITLVSDAKANVPLPATPGDPWAQTLAVAADLAALATPGLVLDTETGLIRIGRARELATALGFDYLPLDDLSADRVLHPIRARLH
ncbi:MAG: magnesium chelatase, partial [Dehalococcoidia bacterium]|nr:magnesium chelatase [Dehalococcoidia bacterium]